MSRAQQSKLIFDAATAASTGNIMNVEDYKILVVSLNTANNANFTIKFQGSILDDVPDFSAAQSVANPWDYIEVLDLEDGTAIDGDVGIAAAGVDDHRLFQVNVDGLKWFNATITAYSAGAITVRAKPFLNN